MMTAEERDDDAQRAEEMLEAQRGYDDWHEWMRDTGLLLEYPTLDDMQVTHDE